MKYCFRIRFLVLALLVVLVKAASGQVTTIPTPAIESQGVKIVFDASQGNGGLNGYAGDVYAHIGVITNLSTSGSDWKYVKADWATNKPECKMTRTGSNTYSLDIAPSIRSFFGVPAGEQIKQVAIVFRSTDGSKTGKTNSGGDIFVDVFTNAIALKLSNPNDGATFLVGESIAVNATANASSIDLFVDNMLVKSSSTSSLSYSFVPNAAKQYSLKAVAKEGNLTEEKSISVNVVGQPVVEELPAGCRPGLNIVDGKATFVLEAPYKKFCSLIGSFNGFAATGNFAMKRTPDGTKFWISIDTLRSNVDYSYQYLVDGKVKIADPYSSLVLDPWNDKYIDSQTYPNMPAYPAGLTSGIVSSFRMNPASYTWQTKSFTPSAAAKLNVYEVHLRDFLAKHDFKALTDTISYFKKLGINTIELMPVNEFEGNNSWGYNPSFYFAVDKYYGPANDLKRFVDECHKEGIAVVMDMVLNHSFGLSPLVQLYYDNTTNKVTPNNPWYNVDSPNTAYAWGYDFNHESQYTKNFVDSVNAYWMREFKIDGFRFDFTKGFTQKAGDGWAYDASRIAILKRMDAEIKKRNPNAFVILEHLTDNSEEKELANAGILLWGNMNNSSCEAAMGYNEGTKSDLSWASYAKRGWSKPNVVAYMESHDEERVSFKQQAYGAANGAYNVKNLATANQRHSALAAIFLSIPGPKMIWQWQELGYDYSINTCENGSISNDCRTNPKPSFWAKYNQNAENKSRMELKSVFEQMNQLRNTYPAFSTSSFKDSLAGAVKYVKLNDSDMDVITMANFDVVERPIQVAVAGSGYYYSHFAKDSIQIANGRITTMLKPGQFHVLTSKRLFVPLKLSILSPAEASSYKVDDVITIKATSSASKATLFVNDVKVADFGANVDYRYTVVKAGTYTIKVVATLGSNVEEKTRTITVADNPVDLKIVSPADKQEFFVGDQIQVSASGNSSAIALSLNGTEVATGVSSISYTYNTTKAEVLKLRFVASNTTLVVDSTITVKVKYKMLPNKFGPNPVAAGGVVSFNIVAADGGAVTIQVLNTNGSVIANKKVSVAKGDNLVPLNTAELAAGGGIYLIRISGCGVNLKEKLVIL